MKKIYYLLLFVLLASVSAKAQTGWVAQKIDTRVLVKFPGAPQKMTKNGFDAYTFKAADSVKYTANAIDFQTIANLDSAALAPMKDTQEFADQLKMGMASSMAKFTFGDVKIGQWKTYTTYDVTATENTNKSMVLTHMTLIGSKMYSLICIVPAGLATKNNEVFFGSIEVGK